jgi:carbon storage regulator
MLVLTRRIGEEIIIGDNIQVTVVAVKGDRVRLGITAAPSIPVMRQELLGQKPQLSEHPRDTTATTSN